MVSQALPRATPITEFGIDLEQCQEKHWYNSLVKSSSPGLPFLPTLWMWDAFIYCFSIAYSIHIVLTQPSSILECF